MVRWVLLGLAVVTFVLALRALRLALRAGPAERTGHLLDAVDHTIGVVLMAALALPGDRPALFFGALILLGPVMVWKGVRDVRARRETKARTAQEDGQAPAEAG